MASIVGVAQADELETLLSAVAPLLVQYVGENFEDDRLVCESLAPEALKAVFPLGLPENGLGKDGTIETIKASLRYSVRTGHPRFMDKLYVGADPIGMIGELITAALNTNLHIYSVAPVFTLMELETISRLGDIFGFGSSSDGVSCPGGSYSNLLAMVTARNTLFPFTKNEGHRDGQRLVVLASADAHYSVTKNVMLMGLGFQSIIKVATTEDGRMLPDSLEKCLTQAIKDGLTPFFVNATAGTTVTGVFDPFDEIAQIAKRFNCWMHIDACWGGSVVFSQQHRHLMKGCDQADSIAWNAHKMMGLPIQSSILLVKQKGVLQQSNELGAGYLFHDNNDYDLGDKTLQCGRRPDILKLFLSWQYHGTSGFGRRVETAFANTSIFMELLTAQPDRFRLVFNPVYVNVCFWFWPTGVDSLETKAERDRVIEELTKRVHARMIQAGKVFVDYSPNSNGPAFFRIIINSPHINQQHLQFALDEIARLGDTAWQEIIERNRSTH